MFKVAGRTMFGGEEGGLAAERRLLWLRPGSHQLNGSDLHVRQLLETLLSVSDHALHRVQLLRHHGDLGLEREKQSVNWRRVGVWAVGAEAGSLYLQLGREYGFKLQAQDVLAVFQGRRRPLLVTAQVLQRLLSSLLGLEPVHHLTRQKIGAVVTPPEGLLAHTHTQKKKQKTEGVFSPVH